MGGLSGEELVKEGWPSRTMYFVQSGVVLLFHDGVAIEAITPGHFFGGDALLILPSEDKLQQVGISIFDTGRSGLTVAAVSH